MRRIVFILLIITIPLSELSAEWLFLKDGSIVRGTIQRESQRTYFLKKGRRLRMIPRNKVIRIRYDRDFLTKYYFYLYRKINVKGEKKATNRISGYIVGSTKSYYIIRYTLNNTTEIHLNKVNIRAMAEAPVKELESKTYTRQPGSTFNNVLGFGIGTGTTLHASYNNDPVALAISVPMMDIRIFYYDKWFDFNYISGFSFTPYDGSPTSNNYIFFEVGFYPFMALNANIGFIMGYRSEGMTAVYNQYHFTSTTYYATMNLRFPFFGLSFRHENKMRFTVAMALPGNYNVTIYDATAPSTNYTYSADQWRSPSCNLTGMLSAEFFTIHLVAFRIEYTFTNFMLENSSAAITNLNHTKHTIRFYVSMGFNVQ